MSNAKILIMCLFLLLLAKLQAQQAGFTEWKMAHHYKYAWSLKKALEFPNIVTHLHISNYTDSIFPSDDIMHMPNLEFLIIDGRFVRDKKTDSAKAPLKLRIDTARLHQLTKLEHLEITTVDFSTFPAELCALPNLKSLSLCICFIKTIPPSIARLKSLEGLDLRLNNISSLPPELAKLDSLNLLYLENNSFTEIPPVVMQMRSLQQLELYNVESYQAKAQIDYHWPYPIYANAINAKAQYELIRQWISSNPLRYMSVSLSDCGDLDELNGKLKLDGIYKSVYLSAKGCKK